MDIAIILFVMLIALVDLACFVYVLSARTQFYEWNNGKCHTCQRNWELSTYDGGNARTYTCDCPNHIMTLTFYFENQR